MANTLRLEIIVDDKGTPVVQKFADGTHAALGKVEDAGGKMGGGFEKSWAGIATGANQAIQLFQELAAVVQAPIMAYMEAEKAELKLGMAMKNQGDFTRQSLQDFQEYAAQIQRTTANEDDLMLSVMGNMKSYGMSNEEVKKATQAAMDLAAAKASEGMTIEKASEIMGKSYLGITSGLKRLGIQVDENAKGAALFDSVLGQVNARFGGSAKAELETYSGQWKQLQNQWGDIQEFLGLVFLKTIQGILTSAGLIGTTFMTAGNLVLGMIRIITTPFTKLLEGFAYLAEMTGLTQTADALRSIASATSEAQERIKIAREATLAWTASQYDGMVATEKVAGAIDKMGIAGQRTKIIDEDAAKAREKAAKEAEKLLDERYKHEMKILLAVHDSEETMRKDAEEGAKTSISSINKMLDERYAHELKISLAIGKAEEDMMKDIEAGVKQTMSSIKKTGSDRLQAERDVYKDLRGYDNQYYEASKALIDKQAANYLALGVSEVAVSAWVEEETRKAKRAETLSTENFFAGVRVGLDDLTQRHTTWAQTGSAVTAAFAAEAEKQMSANFFNVLKGNFDQLNMNWTSLWDSMLQVLADRLAKMATEMLIDRGLSAAGGLISDIIGKSGAAEYIWDLWAGAAVGQWMVREDKLAKIHQGEMIVPKEYAGMFRQLFESGGGTPGPGESFGAGAAQASSTPNMDALNTAEMTGHIGRGAAFGALSGVPGGLAGMATGALTGGLRGGLVGLAHSLSNYMGFTEVGRTAGYMDDNQASPQAVADYAAFNEAIAGLVSMGYYAGQSMAGFGAYGGPTPGEMASAMADAMANAEATSASYAGEYGGAPGAETGSESSDSEGSGSTSGQGSESGSGGAGTGGGGGEGDGGGGDGGNGGGDGGGDGGNGGGRYGGIFRGPDSGYWTRMHGQEAIVPLPNGRSIPVEMKGGENGKPSIGEIRIYLDGEEIKGRVKIIADGVVVERNRRGVNATTRVYS